MTKDREIVVYSHAISNYSERVLGIDVRQTGSGLKDWIREQIVKTVKDPDEIYKSSPNESPIHIRGGIAIPVRDTEDGVEVPTTYRSEKYMRKINREEDGINEQATV